MLSDRDSVHTPNIMLHQEAEFVCVEHVSVVLCGKSRLYLRAQSHHKKDLCVCINSKYA